MNGRPGTRAELAALDHAIGLLRATMQDERVALLESLRDKLTAPFRPRPEAPPIREISEVLGGPQPEALDAWWASVARKAAAVGATVEQAREIGPWLRAQSWGREMTVDRVLYGWPSYLARARAANQRTDAEPTRRDFVPE